MMFRKIKAIIGGALCMLFVDANAQNFKVVLDPGHGGKDFGATRGHLIEKNIVLNVALKVEELLKKDKNITVVCTRRSDVFLALNERSQIANKEKADIFVSIHANAVAGNSDAIGTETFIMGTEKNKSNMEVAKKENAVIVLEKDYKTTYAGFDPNNPSSVLGLTLQQELHVTQSIDLAAKIQRRFTDDVGRKNRGVKQGPFWVLHGAFMPSVLTEVGFISNEDEGEFLNSEDGQNKLAQAIALAILDYKRQHHNSPTVSDVQIKETRGIVIIENADNLVVKPKEEKITTTEIKQEAKKSSIELTNPETVTKKGVIFRVQLAASSKQTATNPSNFKGLKNVIAEKEDNLYKYYYGESTDINYTRKSLEEAKNAGYTSAFLVAFKDGKKVSVQEALK